MARAALRIDMQPDRRQHRFGEQATQKRQRDAPVRVVDAAQPRCIALVIQQVAEVVQQSDRDQRTVGIRLLGQVRRLQPRFELRDRLAAVPGAANAGDKQFNVGRAEPDGNFRGGWQSRLGEATPLRGCRRKQRLKR